MIDSFDISTIISVVIGGVITIASQWYLIRKEDNGNQNVVMYYLLEIHYILSRLYKLENMNKTWFESLFEKLTLPNQISDKDWTEIKKILFDFVFKISFNDLISIKDNYNKSTELLARENPVLAYQVRGLSEVVERGDRLASSILSQSFGAEDMPAEFKSILDEFYLNLSLKDSLKLTKDSILRCIPWYLVIKQVRVRRMLMKSESFDAQDVELEKLKLAIVDFTNKV